MKRNIRTRIGAPFLAAGLGLLISGQVVAGPEDFSTGPLIEAYGPRADIETTQPLPQGASFRIAFDLSERAEKGSLNRSLVTAARFLNMHAAQGVESKDMRLALVIHGGAVHDVTSASAGPNAALVDALQSHGVRLIVCGQSAAYMDIGAGDLLAGVEMALSAMTAHALLQQAGYTLNPF